MQVTQRPLKEKQRQEREALILQIAEEVMLEKGYYDTSMDEIAARVGIAKGTVYLHFPSKEELVIAIFTQDLQKFSQTVDETMASASTLRAKLEAFLFFMYGGFYSKRTQLLYAIYTNMELRRLFHEKGGCIREMWEQLTAHLTTLVEEGKAAGELNAMIPTNIMIAAFFSLLSPRNYERLIVGEHVPPAELASYLANIYFHGVAVPKESH